MVVLPATWYFARRDGFDLYRSTANWVNRKSGGRGAKALKSGGKQRSTVSPLQQNLGGNRPPALVLAPPLAIATLVRPCDRIGLNQ